MNLKIFPELKIASENLVGLLQKFYQPRKKMDYLDIKKELEKVKDHNKSFRSERSQAVENFHFNQLEDNFSHQESKPNKNQKNFIEINAQ